MIDILANELKEIILIEFLDLKCHPEELRQMATVCRALYDFLRPFLWHRIKLHTPCYSLKLEPCAKVLEALSPAGQSPLNTDVKELRIDDYAIQNDTVVLPSDPRMFSSDPMLPRLLRELPNLQKLVLCDVDWRVLPFLNAVKSCLAISLKTVMIHCEEIPLDILEHCHHVETLWLLGNLTGTSKFMNNTPELRHLLVRVEAYQYPFYSVWRRLNTSKLETLDVIHYLLSDEDYTNVYPNLANLRSLTITFDEDGDFKDRPEEWPSFESLAELLELTVIYKSPEDFIEVDDRSNRLAAWLGRIDPFMGKLERLIIEFPTLYPDNIVVSDFVGLEELDAQLARLQLTTLKKVLIAVCPHDLNGSARDYVDEDDGFGAFGAVTPEADEEFGREEGQAWPGEEHRDSFEARTAGSVKIIWDALAASRARAPDFISVKAFRRE
ncbi:hypothetical protein H0H92_009421 [Tricholoma furcatifolium]|nr:hypothetical protein H0H92_009421 [Tricholoma furcatifolium]